MKSIKEKSEEYGYTNWQSDEYHDGASEGLEFDPIGHTQTTSEAGANYVPEQIERKLDEFSNFEDSLIVRRLIEQLKK